jgi:hypothetical protein
MSFSLAARRQMGLANFNVVCEPTTAGRRLKQARQTIELPNGSSQMASSSGCWICPAGRRRSAASRRWRGWCADGGRRRMPASGAKRSLASLACQLPVVFGGTGLRRAARSRRGHQFDSAAHCGGGAFATAPAHSSRPADGCGGLIKRAGRPTTTLAGMGWCTAKRLLAGRRQRRRRRVVGLR